MPSLSMRYRRVVRLIPSRAAAPVGPPTTQWASRRTSRIRHLSISRRLSWPLPAAEAIVGMVGRSSDSGAVNCPSASQDHGPLDEVLQLSNVTRPGVFGQGCDRVGRYSLDPLIHSSGVLADKVAHQKWNVFSALAQRRYGDGKNVKPVEQIAAELSVRDHLQGACGWWRRSCARLRVGCGYCPGARIPVPAGHAAA